MAYCTTAEVRLLTNLTTSDVSDDDMGNIIPFAADKLNHDIQVKVSRERIDYIDGTRENTIDGSNTTFYVKNWRDYIGDGDDDADVDTSDITVYQVDSDGTETELTVITITHDDGSFVLDSAPSNGVTLYVTYHTSPVDMSTPHSLVKLASVQLVAALCYAKINIGKAPKFKAGNVQILRDVDAYHKFMKLYMETLDQIRKLADIVEAERLI